MTVLTKAAILAAQDLRSEEVNVPEWGGSVRVRLLTAAEREEISSIWTQHASSSDDAKMHLTRDAILLRCTVDEGGKPLFAPEDLPALKQKSAVALARVIDAAMVLNAMAAQSLEDAVKNSNGGQTADSSSDSPANSAAQ